MGDVREGSGDERPGARELTPRDKLKVMLQSRAESGSAVSREDIESFFADLKKSRR